jgi:hypothetical protein
MMNCIRIDELSEMGNATREELELLRLERNTWYLIQSVMAYATLYSFKLYLISQTYL